MAIPIPGESTDPDVSQHLVTGNAGDVVFKEGDLSADLYVIQSGRVELVRLDAGELRRVALLESGDFFGELSLLDGTPRDVTARALGTFSALRINRDTFNQVVRENPEIPVRMLRRLAQRLLAQRGAVRPPAASAMEPPRGVDRASQAILRAAGVDVPTPGVARPAASAPVFPAPAPGRTPSPAAARPPADAVTPGGAAYFVHLASGTELPIPASGTSTVGRFDRTTGRSPDVDLTALDPNRTSGRHHARVTFRDGEYRVLEDAATANGTLVNDARIVTGRETVLADGDRVRFGLVDLVFHRR
jgi:hypothetical protein